MQAIEILVLLFLCAIGLAWLARHFNLPYPIALVVGGAALGFAPRLPRLEIDPNLMLALFLPPILYGAAYFTSWRDFRRYLRPILMLAIGLVLVTTAAVAWVAHSLIGLPWPVAFALGAIVSPPDAVAATSILGRLKLPRRITTIVEGESLVNDASGLVLYRFAVAAAATGNFSVAEATGQFLLVAVGGIAFGWAVGRLAAYLHVPLKDSLLEITFTFVVAYAAYLGAEALHVSGVLAVVAAGLIQGRRAVTAFTPETRMLGVGAWSIVIFALNTLVFILIGLELPDVVADIAGYGWSTLLGQAAAVSVVAILVRMLWVFPGAYLPRWCSARVRRSEPRPPWQWIVVIGWCGMRGIVSLAAALALPESLPGRDLVIFLTFAVILATLVVQGLTLLPLIRWLRISGDWSVLDEERVARERTALAALAAVQRTAASDGITGEALDLVAAEYRGRSERVHPGHLVMTIADDPVLRLRRAALAAEREALIGLWRSQTIGDETLHQIERELDLEESRLMR